MSAQEGRVTSAPVLRGQLHAAWDKRNGGSMSIKVTVPCPVCEQENNCHEDQQFEPCQTCWGIGWRARPGGVYFRDVDQPSAALPPFAAQEDNR